jgi:hypothetical protein
MALDSLIIWNDISLDAYMRDPLDAVGRDLDRRAIQVESATKINASGRPGPNVITGRLRASITWRPGEDSLGQYRDVGSGVHYAPFVELGHPNVAHGFRKRDGTYGYVSNRPTKAYAYLRPALAAALL